MKCDSIFENVKCFCFVWGVFLNFATDYLKALRLGSLMNFVLSLAKKDLLYFVSLTLATSSNFWGQTFNLTNLIEVSNFSILCHFS